MSTLIHLFFLAWNPFLSSKHVLCTLHTHIPLFPCSGPHNVALTLSNFVGTSCKAENKSNLTKTHINESLCCNSSSSSVYLPSKLHPRTAKLCIKFHRKTFLRQGPHGLKLFFWTTPLLLYSGLKVCIILNVHDAILTWNSFYVLASYRYDFISFPSFSIPFFSLLVKPDSCYLSLQFLRECFQG